MELKEDHPHLIQVELIIFIKTHMKKKSVFFFMETQILSVSSIIKKVQPDEIYNLAAQSHVAVSFEVPEYTANADAIGVLRILNS